MSNRLAFLIPTLVIATTVPAQGQTPQPLPATPVRFESWQPGAPFEPRVNPARVMVAATSRDRARHGLIGGAIGVVAAVAFCTTVSTLANDSAEGGLSTCPISSYLLMGAAGFAAGFAIGWVL
jgi:hypothetical protein